MSLLVRFQITILCLILSTMGEAFGSPLSDWEGNKDAEGGEAPRGFVDDTMIPVPESNLEENVNPIMEVALTPKRQMQSSHKSSHIDLAKVPVSAISAKDIKDETATTRDKAKRKPLPDFLLQEKAQDSDMLAINHVSYQLYD